MDNLTLATHNQRLSLWIERIKEYQASNQTVAAWCETNNICIKTYYNWMRKIKREAFDALPMERKTRATKSLLPTFAELPKPTTSMEQISSLGMEGQMLEWRDRCLFLMKPK